MLDVAQSLFVPIEERQLLRLECTAEKIGGKFTVYWTLGKYDGVGILEAPNDEAAMEFGIRIGSLGNVRTSTLKAFSEEEIARVVDKLG